MRVRQSSSSAAMRVAIACPASRSVLPQLMCTIFVTARCPGSGNSPTPSSSGTRWSDGGKQTLFQLTRQVFEEYRPHLFWLDAFEHNQYARPAYQAVGFREESILQEAIRQNNAYSSFVITSMLEREYFQLTTQWGIFSKIVASSAVLLHLLDALALGVVKK